jgi:NADPH-dependent curcumin reductase CurA
MVPTQTRILFARTPEGQLRPDDFAPETGLVGDPRAGELLCRNILLSIDPAARAWIQSRTYREQVLPGQVMPGFTLSEVIRSHDPRHPVGTIVLIDGGWQEYAVVPGSTARPITVRAPLTHHLSTLGLTGVTAWVGLHEVGRPRSGETMVVSAAAGATGNVAGQLGRAVGMRVVGIAGSDDKCTWLVNELGFDGAVNHRSPELRRELKALCPDGVDLYFDNVGGPLLDQLLTLLNARGRVVCCGAVSQYDTDSPAPGPRFVPGLVVTKRLRLEGFIVTDHEDTWARAEQEMAELIADGRLRVAEQVVDGLAGAPSALVGLLAGNNIGKQLVRIAPDPG